MSGFLAGIPGPHIFSRILLSIYHKPHGWAEVPCDSFRQSCGCGRTAPVHQGKGLLRRFHRGAALVGYPAGRFFRRLWRGMGQRRKTRKPIALQPVIGYRLTGRQTHGGRQSCREQKSAVFHCLFPSPYRVFPAQASPGLSFTLTAPRRPMPQRSSPQGSVA